MQSTRYFHLHNLHEIENVRYSEFESDENKFNSKLNTNLTLQLTEFDPRVLL